MAVSLQCLVGGCLLLLLVLLATPGHMQPVPDTIENRHRFDCSPTQGTIMLQVLCKEKISNPRGDLCGGDVVLDADGVQLPDPYSPCHQSSCVGVVCPIDSYLVQRYTHTPTHNVMIGRGGPDALDRCYCTYHMDSSDSFPPEYILPGSPERQPDDPVCKSRRCYRPDSFLLTRSGRAEDCECCDNNKLLSMVPPPKDYKFENCVPAEGPVRALPSFYTFRETARALCPLDSPLSAIPDDTLFGNADAFCCSLRGAQYCGAELADMRGPGTAQCRYITADTPIISCCASVDALGGAVPQGSMCS